MRKELGSKVLLKHDAALALYHAQHMYPELGVELPERHYGEDCALLLPGGGVNWKVCLLVPAGWLARPLCRSRAAAMRAASAWLAVGTVSKSLLR